MKLTRQNVKKLLPEGIEHLSLGATHCAYMLNGILTITSYADVTNTKVVRDDSENKS